VQDSLAWQDKRYRNNSQRNGKALTFSPSLRVGIDPRSYATAGGYAGKESSGIKTSANHSHGVNMRLDGTGASVGFANAASEVDGENIYITKDAFVAVKDIHSTPSYVAAAGNDGLNYLTWGVWSVESAHTGLAGATVLDGSHWIAGTMTPTHDMPTTGTASYAEQVLGTADEGGILHALDGTSNLTANFGTDNIGGALNINYANGGGAYATSDLSSVSIHNGNQFGGSLGGTDSVDTIQGVFYGSGAAEVDGNWSINKNGGASHATGVFTGKKE